MNQNQSDVIWIDEPWQVTAQRKLISAQLMLVEGQFSDIHDLVAELKAIAEVLSGLPTNWVDQVTDGGCFPQELN